MCQLCSAEHTEVLAERKRLQAQADRLRALAKDLECLAYGKTHPHGGTAKQIGLSAQRVIKSLVEDWM